MGETAVDFLLEYLNQRISCEEMYDQFSMFEKFHIKSRFQDLSSLRTFLIDSERSWYNKRHEKLNDLVLRITDMANEAEDIIDLSRVSNIIKKKDRIRMGGTYQSGMLNNVLKEIKSLKKEVSKIYDKKLYGIGDPHVQMYSGETSSSSSSSSSLSKTGLLIVEEETVVGFDNDVERIRERLAGGSKHLDVISIVGMAGLGKTTLTKKLYNDDFVVYHFYIRGWTYVSQVYVKRDLLTSILSSVVEHREEKLYTMSDEKLGEELYKSLKGKRYLIVMDDMWNIGTWDDMKIYFPNDNNGSRIIITSRLTEVALHAKPDSPPHLLHFLTIDKSWDLLKFKVFGKESCPPDLVEIGEQIAKKCQGLPLAIVVVAGLLARTDKKKEEWEKVAGRLSSHIANDLEQCMNNTLELSYNHLPRHLRLCFLYFGAFPEDYEICVKKLIYLWIAEGFIRKMGRKTLEDIAEEYLTDLIDRSLVLVAKRKFSGGVKACRVHDLLRDLCLRKGKEENFMQQIYNYRTLPPLFSFGFNLSRLFNPSFSLIPVGEKQRRLCIFSNSFDYISLTPCAPRMRSLLFFASERNPLLPETSIASVNRAHEVSLRFVDRFLEVSPSLDYSYDALFRRVIEPIRAIKLLRVLDFSSLYLTHFPPQVLQLVLLRYLALRGSFLTLPESISELLNLEMLDLSLSQAMTGIVPPDIWKMVSLRHLRIHGKSYAFPPDYTTDRGYAGYPSVLHNLQTILQLCPSESCQVILERTPNLRKLGFCGLFVLEEGNFWFPDLHFLNHLETLKLNRTSFGTRIYNKRWNFQGLKFPPNLRRLTLSGTYLEWEAMSTIGLLCNLEVLKLEYSACVGPLWETTGGGFRRLKFMRLKHIDIEQWEASNTDFPSLQQLVLHGCGKFEEIPFEFGDISTLQRIEVKWCSQSSQNSARRIQEEQQNMGNDWLKIVIKPTGFNW